MSDKPKRKWFQIHLSTAIVLMFVAGGMIWANTVTYGAALIADHRPDGTIDTFVPSACGFPQRYIRFDVRHGYEYWEFGGLAIDVFVGMLMIVGVASGCESFIRRREAV